MNMNTEICTVSQALTFSEWAAKGLWSVHDGRWYPYQDEDNPISGEELWKLWANAPAPSSAIPQREESEMKLLITDYFSRTSFALIDPIPLDVEIEDFIHRFGECHDVITTNSCAGHDSQSHPYLAFVVSNSGWDIFWLRVLPEIAGKCLVHTEIIHEDEKTAILLRAHFENKDIFWLSVKSSFEKFFHSAHPSPV